MTRVSRAKLARRTCGGFASAAVLLAAGCAAAAPAQLEIHTGVQTIMTGLGLSTEGAERVADCMTPELIERADPASQARFADGRHAVIPADERWVSNLEATCLLATESDPPS